MGRGAAPARTSWSSWTASGLFLLVATFLLCKSRIEAHVCPSYCVCSVAMDSFHHVVCERASLDSIPRQVPSKPNTTFLNMAWNHVTIIRERDLDDFKQLQGLVMDHNKLNTIDKKAFHRCPRLTLLRLAHNNLRSLDVDLFKETPHLQFLDLSFNKIILLPKQPFLKSRSLVFLNLTATDLSVVPDSAFADTPNIGHLELSNNLLAQVSVEALDVLVKRNVTVLLGSNPLRCDCELKRTWAWVQGRAPAAGAGAPPHATCDQPAELHGRPWGELRRLECGGGAGAGGAAHASYVLYAIAGLLVVITALVAAAVWALRRRWRRKGVPHGCVGGRRKHRLAPPVGEYIDVLGDPPPPKEPIYDALRDPPPKDVAKEQREDADSQRYVTDLSRNTYLAPIKLSDDGPIYVNMKGPPLPLRRPSDAAPAPAPAPAPDAAPDAARPAQNRPCSIPLLEGCDFYEVVD
ncbi:hypothetical protein R5R35_008229 [Gryllus longicercus]|uniref:LRRCT domain-containing protein n=1 Tax=Gryllus longicercus TaxID=2509291 RepID=A0AAN9VR66_9ORTH